MHFGSYSDHNHSCSFLPWIIGTYLIRNCAGIPNNVGGHNYSRDVNASLQTKNKSLPIRRAYVMAPDAQMKHTFMGLLSNVQLRLKIVRRRGGSATGRAGCCRASLFRCGHALSR